MHTSNCSVRGMHFLLKIRTKMFSTCINYLSSQPSWLLLISSLGLLSLLNTFFSLLKWTYTRFFRPTKKLKNYGSWALITGATDGIGKAFAHRLAQEGLNLILVSRNPNKLKTVSSEIKEEFPNTKIKIVEFDFARKDSSSTGFWWSIDEAIKGLEVGVLINNVGITYPAATFFHEVDEKVWMDIVRVNLMGTTRLTRAVLPGMLQRRRGAIVDIGSGAAIVVPSHPLYTIYAATKAYIDQLSRCLYVEYKHCGIDVQCQVPLYVATKMISKAAFIEKSSLFIPSPGDYAGAAIRQIGYEARCTPYWAYSLQWAFSSLVPEFVLDAWRLSIGIRQRGKLVL